MKKLITSYWLLIAVLVLAAFLRFWRLGSFPALNADEAALGYNAYSLIQTGKDEHGNPWPIHFQSFNDYKPGLYVYLIVPFIKFFGLNALSVRAPGAVVGVATVLVIYLLVRELLQGLSLKLPLIAAALLAISPWHLHFSRGGWEVGVATFFITSGIYLFLKKRYLLSVFGFVSSFYTYHAARLIVPLLGLGLLLIYWKEVKGSLRKILAAGLVGVVLVLPLARDLTTGAVASRAAGVGLFADQGPLARVNEQRGEHTNLAGLSAIFLHNKAVNYGLAFAQNWVEHFWGDFLFISGDEIQRNKVPELGQLYLFEIVTVVVGIGVLIKQSDRSAKIIFWWLAVAPVAAALTFQSPHALRSHNMIIPLTLVSAIGMVTMVKWLNGYSVKRLRVAGYGLLTFVVIWSFLRYEHEYWVHMAREYPFSSQYGVKELVGYIKSEGSKYNEIIITDRYDQPYILTLFYLQCPPEKLQSDHQLTGRDNYGFSTVRSFDKYRFRSIKFDEERPDSPRALIVGTDKEIPDEANVIKEIYGENGYLYFQAVAN